MTQRERPEPDRASLPRLQRGGDGAVTVRDLGGAHQRGEVRRRLLGLRKRGFQYRRKFAHLFGGPGIEKSCDRKVVFETRRIQKGDFRARQRRFPHAMRQHRHFAAQVRTDDQQALEMIHVGDAHAQVRIQRIGGLIAEVTHAQAMIDVLRTQTPGQAVQQVQLLGRRRGAAERA
jgi:hypothetical protein